MLDRIRLLLSIQKATLGQIRPQVRVISAGIQEKRALVKVYFDSPPTDADVEIVDTIMTEIISDFPQNGGYQFEFECIHSMLPIKDLDKLDAFVFVRFEPESHPTKINGND